MPLIINLSWAPVIPSVRRQRLRGDRVLEVTGGWTCKSNLTLFLEMLAYVARYDLTAEELETLQHRAERTDVETGQWAEWQFVGAHAISLRLAADPGTEVLHFQVVGTEEIEAAVALLGEVMCNYRLAR